MGHIATNARFKKSISGTNRIIELQDEIFSLVISGELLRVEQVGDERGIILGTVGDIDSICRSSSIVDEITNQAIANIGRVGTH